MLFKVAGLLMFSMTMQSTASSASEIDLFCQGNGDKFVSSQTKVRQADGSTKTLYSNRHVPFSSSIRLTVAGGKGRALIPNEMLADDDARGWHDINKLSVTDQMINGKVNFNWLFSPVMTLDRRTGILTIKGSMANFSGKCSPFDARTSRMPTPVVRQASPTSVQSNSRTNARAMAGAAVSREAARASAIKADLAFRLFNASQSPIIEMVMIDSKGVLSSNWLKSGALAPQAFRSLNFTNSKTCIHRVRITYANGTRGLQPIDFCGKDVLYAQGADIWAE